MAFGKLVGRFGILWKPLRMHWKRAGIIAMTCAKLHNVIITHDIKAQQYYSDQSRRTTLLRDPQSIANDTLEEIVDEMRTVGRNMRGRRARVSTPIFRAPNMSKDGAPCQLLNDSWRYRASKATCSKREMLCARVKALGVIRSPTSSLDGRFVRNKEASCQTL